MKRNVRSLAFLAAWLVAAPLLEGQDLVTAARPQVRTREELLSALRTAIRGGNPNQDVEEALIGSWGEPVVSWALEVATDRDADPDLRGAALNVLYFARPRHAVPSLVRMAEERPGNERWWYSALLALQSFPFPELAPTWRRLLADPRHWVRQVALRGLARTGSPEDARIVESLSPVTRAEGEARDHARVALGRPREARSDELFGTDTVGGRFVPTAEWLRGYRPYLCRKVRCEP